MRTLDTIQLNRQKLNFQSYPKPKKQFVCLHGKMSIFDLSFITLREISIVFKLILESGARN